MKKYRLRKISFISYAKLILLLFVITEFLYTVFIDMFLKDGKITVRNGIFDFSLSKTIGYDGLSSSFFQGNTFIYLIAFFLVGAITFQVFSFIFLKFYFNKRDVFFVENLYFMNQQEFWRVKKIDKQIFVKLFMIPFILYQFIGFLVQSLLASSNMDIHKFNQLLSEYLVSTFYFAILSMISLTLINIFLKNSEGMKLKFISYEVSNCVNEVFTSEYI